MRKHPIIIPGSSLDPRAAAHPGCHGCFCYPCELTSKQRGRRALRGLLFAAGVRAEFPAPGDAWPCHHDTAGGCPCPTLPSSSPSTHPQPLLHRHLPTSSPLPRIPGDSRHCQTRGTRPGGPDGDTALWDSSSRAPQLLRVPEDARVVQQEGFARARLQ